MIREHARSIAAGSMKYGNGYDRRSGLSAALLDHAGATPCVGGNNVRFESEADICSAQTRVRLTPNSNRESRLPRKIVSVLSSKTDVCGGAQLIFRPIKAVK
jgi:hypothetical protein